MSKYQADPSEPFAERCGRAGAVLRALGADILLASDPATIRWLTGREAEIQYGPPYPFSAGTFLVLEADGQGRIVCPADQRSGPPVAGLEIETYEAYSLTPLRPFAHARRLLGELKGRIAIEAHALPAALLPVVRWVEATDALAALRLIKDRAEIEAIERAAAVVSVGQRAFRAGVQPGITEISLFGRVQWTMQDFAGTRVPTYPDLMSGPRVTEVGQPPIDRPIAANELVLCDLVVRVGGYWADSCTTVCAGRPTQRMRRLHQACRGALERGSTPPVPGLPRLRWTGCSEGQWSVRGSLTPITRAMAWA